MSAPVKIFILEDDEFYSKWLEYQLSLHHDREVRKFETATEMLKHLHEQPAVVTLDYYLPDMKGDEVFKRIKSELPDVPVIVISGQEDVSVAVELLKEGAYDYIKKGEDAKQRLLNVVNTICENVDLRKEVNSLRSEIVLKHDFGKRIIGESKVIKQCFGLMEMASGSNITVSITGETGTGKELVAKCIHYNSDRKKNLFVPVNVAAIPRELLESELFGHEKGAFTGAVDDRIGKFEVAHNGTLFLDEIGEMDMAMQAKILRVLQEQEVTRVGSNKVVKLDVRIIVATHKDIGEEVRKGTFREDLYYRLLGLPINLAPLRNRGNDELILAKHFLDQYAKESGSEPMELTEAASAKIKEYPFPGNIRELKAVIDLAAVLSDGKEIRPEHIQFHSASSLNSVLNEGLTLKQYIHNIVKYHLVKNNDDVLLVAKKLDIGKSTIYRMLKED